MREKIVLIGAGSAMFTRGLVADLIKNRREADLALVDIDPEALAVAEKLTRKMIDLRNAPIRLSATVDRRAALAGATAVICTIGVGGRRGWEQDVFIPRRYGIYQPVGDSVMPGGTSRALRMIPAMVAIARDVQDLAPEALFFNYGNPMAPVCRAVRKATGANLVGLCHGVNHVGQYLAGVLDVSPTDFEYAAAGMNHLTWFTEFRVKGQDARPRLLTIARERRENDPESGGAEDGKRVMADPCPFSWRLFELIGAFPAVLDRHVTEFFPRLFAAKGSYYGKTLGVDAYSFESAIALGDKIFDEMRTDALSPAPLRDEYFDQFSGEHEQVIEIIDCIRADRKRVFSANLPNRGQVPNLPPESVVEGPVLATGSGLHPIQHGPLPTAAAGVLATRLMWVETVVEAALEGSRTKFIQALLLDGAVDSLDVAEQLADDLLQAHAKDLPQFSTTKEPTCTPES